VIKTRLLPPLLAILAVGCAARRIPGTEIEDSKDARAILTLMEVYRSGVEHKDAQSLLGLVGDHFVDNAGTANPDDDLDAQALQTVIPQRLARLEDLKIDLEVRRIEVVQDQAAAVYYWTVRFRIPSLTSRSQQESDLKKMTFERQGNAWKIVSGI
jgi:hypothetical protein